MADVYMHIRMTKDLIQLRQADVEPSAAFLGAQFTDPMYYVTFHKDHKRYRRIADRTHDTNTRELLINVVNHVKTHPTDTNRSFLFGFLAHYALDVKLHPYVYHHVGIYQIDNPATHGWRGLHLKFERSIDAVLYEQDTGKPSRFLRLTNDFITTKRAHPDLKLLMQDVLGKQFAIEDGGDVFHTGVKHMYWVLRLLTTDRFGWKKALFRLVDVLVKSRYLFVADMSFYNHVEPYDFLNLEHRTWHHPVTNEPSNKSVPDLYDEAIAFANELLDNTDKYLAGEAIDLSTVFTNLSLNSGVDCDRSKPFQYFHIYRPKNNS